ncbi:MAG: DUF1049 domain-containing protein [candidate division Zixibacteria bacterium]|nr:DUF1049 domain-containing protein [candidate division Zixibacteria bacterium]
MQDAKAYILLGLLVVFLIVVAQNTQVVTLRFLFWRLQISQVPLLLLVGLIGFTGGYVMRMVQVSRRRGKGGSRDTTSSHR